MKLEISLSLFLIIFIIIVCAIWSYNNTNNNKITQDLKIKHIDSNKIILEIKDSINKIIILKTNVITNDTIIKNEIKTFIIRN